MTFYIHKYQMTESDKQKNSAMNQYQYEAMQTEEDGDKKVLFGGIGRFLSLLKNIDTKLLLEKERETIQYISHES